MSRIIDFLSDLIWGGGNPATDTYHDDWSMPSARNTGSRVGEIAQSSDEFIASITREQIRADQRAASKGDSSGPGMAGASRAGGRRPVVTAAGR